jgi:hypothetical protein
MRSTTRPCRLAAFAAQASTAVAVIEQMEVGGTGMQTGHLIGMAQGMLILRYGVDEDQSFRFLSRIAQQFHIKLRDGAARVLAVLPRLFAGRSRRLSASLDQTGLDRDPQ